MIERFEGKSGRPNLIEALRNQKIVAGNPDLAERIADMGVLVEINQGTAIIDQGAEDTDTYLIIAGAFDIVVNGRKVARRFANDHVGEMAAIQPTQRRSATVTATEKSVLCKLTEPQLSQIARQYPDVWRFIAKELSTARATERACNRYPRQDPDLHHLVCRGTRDCTYDSECFRV